MTTPFDFVQSKEKSGYDNDFFCCFFDPISCLAAWCCICCTVGYTKGQLDDSTFDVWSCLCAPIGAYRNRRRVIAMYNKQETEDGSMCAIGLCGCCAIAQDCHEVMKNKSPSKQQSSSEPAAAEEPAKE